jgi:hypothetical protein
MVAKKMQVETEGDVTVISEVTETYWKITSMDFLFLEMSLGLILYPGSYAYITGTQKDALPEYSLQMVQLSEITEKEYQDKIGGQGLLGLG